MAQAGLAALDRLWSARHGQYLCKDRITGMLIDSASIGIHVTLMATGATSGWDILVGNTDPKLVHFEVDIGWVQSAGLDPAQTIRKLGPRVRQLHLKDVAAGAKTNFALETKPTVAGTGVVDWPAVLRAAWSAGVQHAYVEQEPPFAIPRMEAARQSAAFFRALMI